MSILLSACQHPLEISLNGRWGIPRVWCTLSCHCFMLSFRHLLVHHLLFKQIIPPTRKYMRAVIVFLDLLHLLPDSLPVRSFAACSKLLPSFFIYVIFDWRIMFMLTFGVTIHKSSHQVTFKLPLSTGHGGHDLFLCIQFFWDIKFFQNVIPY